MCRGDEDESTANKRTVLSQVPPGLHGDRVRAGRRDVGAARVHRFARGQTRASVGSGSGAARGRTRRTSLLHVVG